MSTPMAALSLPGRRGRAGRGPVRAPGRTSGPGHVRGEPGRRAALGDVPTETDGTDGGRRRMAVGGDAVGVRELSARRWGRRAERVLARGPVAPPAVSRRGLGTHWHLPTGTKRA